MTDSLNVQKCKNRIKIIIGEADYSTFMQHLSGTATIVELERRWLVRYNTLSSWIRILGYRDGTTRTSLLRHQMRMRRIEERNKKNEILTKFLLKNSALTR